MSAEPTHSNPKLEQAGASDESIQEVHHALLKHNAEPVDGYDKMPLVLLGLISSLIFFASIYMVHYRGGFDSLVYHEGFDPASQVVVETGPADPRVAGRRHFLATCAVCHQPTGTGIPGAFAPLVNSERVLGDPERLVRIVLHGLQGPIEGVTYAGIMAPFGQGSPANLSDQRIAEILSYIRSEWGHDAPEITPAEVTAIRTAVGTRTQSWTLEELNAQ